MKFKSVLLILVLIPPAILAFIQSMPADNISNAKNLLPLPQHADSTVETESIEKDLTVSLAANRIEQPEKSAEPPALTGIDRLKAMVSKTELQAAVLHDHDQYQRYPPENYRIESPHQDPITQRYAIDQRTTMTEDHSLGITVWTDQKFYLAGDTIEIYALIENAKGEKLASSLITSVVFQQKEISKKLEFTRQQDATYKASIELTSESENPLAQSMMNQPGIYKVLIASPQHELQDAVTFTLSQPDIVLTGNYKDRITSQGDLIIEAEVETFSSQRFYIQASLYSSTQLPVGSSQFSQTLNQGTHWIPLTFAGRLMHDSEESGPYILKQVSLAKVSMPMQRAPAVMPEYQTEAYALSEFSEQTYAESSLNQ